jgi:argininosuccinate lyase
MRPAILGRLAVLALAFVLTGAPQPTPPGNARLYRYLVQQNQAQLVMLAETGLMPKDLATRLARALAELEATNRSSPNPPSANYLDLEEALVAKLGPEASNIHMGRSRNDLGATSERLILRDDLLETLRAMAALRQTLIALAEQNTETVMPGFTHAVQAQPTTLAHALSAYLAGLERDEERLREAYRRVNVSPLGVAAFTTSGIRLDRHRLAELMGFPALLENGYDAIMVSTVDSKAEIAAALAIASLNLGRFAQQFVTQYADSRPGLNLSDDAVGHSSIMPQKRNPRHAERVRILASAVLGDAQTVLLTAHNTPGGEVADIRVPLLDRTRMVTANAIAMLRLMDEFVRAIRVDSARTLELVNEDYSVMTELADTLQREAGIPFRVGHKVAAELSAYGRAQGKRPIDLTLDDVAGVYRTVTGRPLPLNAQQVRSVMSAERFVRGRRGLGGPQPEETNRMLAAHTRRLQELREWLATEQARLDASERALDAAFRRLL